MTAGYSKTPLIKKLGIKQGFVIKLVDEPEYYQKLLGTLPKDVRIINGVSKVNFVHWFVKEKQVLQKRLPQLKKQIFKDGMIWVSWPKKISKIKTDLDENVIRETALKSGLVDVKVCAVDEVWSGLKLVFRLKDRV